MSEIMNISGVVVNEYLVMSFIIIYSYCLYLFVYFNIYFL